MRERRTQNETFNRTKAPFKDEANRVITFNFARYHIPAEEGSRFDILYNKLANAVAESDKYELDSAIEELEPYRLNSFVRKSLRQSEIVDALTKKVIH